MYKVRILVGGSPIKQYHDREGRLWVEARYGTKYEIEVKNETWKRALAVVSVDGLNVINAKHENPEQSTGYVIHPYGNVRVRGWRTSSDTVKEFYFTAQEDSYSKKLGADVSNTGVIGTVIYEELPTYTYTYTTTPTWPNNTTPWNPNPWYGVYNMSTDEGIHIKGMSNTGGMMSSSAPLTTDSSPVLRRAATGSGETREDHSHKVSFGTKVFAAAITIYYDTLEGLRNRGIYLTDWDSELPKPFPNGDYCPNV
jgi:hypothetical protein